MIKLGGLPREAPPTPVLVGDTAAQLLRAAGFPMWFGHALAFALITVGWTVIALVTLCLTRAYFAIQTGTLATNRVQLRLITLCSFLALVSLIYVTLRKAAQIHTRLYAAAKENTINVSRLSDGPTPPPSSLNRETAAHLLRRGETPRRMEWLFAVVSVAAIITSVGFCVGFIGSAMRSPSGGGRAMIVFIAVVAALLFGAGTLSGGVRLRAMANALLRLRKIAEAKL